MTAFNSLMASIGHLLLQWGALEERMLVHQRSPSEIPLELRRVRHLLAHCLIGAQVKPGSVEGAFVRCRALDGKGSEVVLTLVEIEAAISAIERWRLDKAGRVAPPTAAPHSPSASA